MNRTLTEIGGVEKMESGALVRKDECPFGR
jgi:hypothetical protein